MATNTIKFSAFAAGSLSNTTNQIVGVSSPSGGTNFKLPAINTWTTVGRPSSPVLGVLGFNTNLSQYEYWNGATWVQFAAGGSGTVGLGSINDLAYYAATGTAVSSLMTQVNSILYTNLSGVPNWLASTASGLLTASLIGTPAWLSTSASSVLTSTSGNVPIWSTTLPNAVQISVNNLGNGTGASASTFFRGDGTWAPIGTNTVSSNYIQIGTFIMQWGTTSPIGPNSASGVSFPIAFPTQCSNVVATCMNTTTGIPSAAAVSSFSTTSFIAYNTTQAGPGNSICWQAIGF